MFLSNAGRLPKAPEYCCSPQKWNFNFSGRNSQCLFVILPTLSQSWAVLALGFISGSLDCAGADAATSLPWKHLQGVFKGRVTLLSFSKVVPFNTDQQGDLQETGVWNGWRETGSGHGLHVATHTLSRAQPHPICCQAEGQNELAQEISREGPGTKLGRWQNPFFWEQGWIRAPIRLWLQHPQWHLTSGHSWPPW